MSVDIFKSFKNVSARAKSMVIGGGLAGPGARIRVLDRTGKVNHGRNGNGKKRHTAGQGKRKSKKKLMLEEVYTYPCDNFFVFTFFHNG